MSLSVPILMYHLVSPRPVRGFEKYTLTPKKFAAQMVWLVRTGHTSLTLDSLIDARRARRALPRKPVVITFDDGYRDCIDYAVPVLRDLGLTAVIFVVAGLVGRTSQWLVREHGIEDIPLLDWSDAQQLNDAGIRCESHAMTHARLGEIKLEECRYELEESRRLLSARLGHEVRHLSFPYGSYNLAVQLAAREAGYRSACSTRAGLSPPEDDIFALYRVPVNGQDTLADFICSLYTGRTIGAHAREKARTFLRRPRTRVA